MKVWISVKHVLRYSSRFVTKIRNINKNKSKLKKITGQEKKDYYPFISKDSPEKSLGIAPPSKREGSGLP